MESIENSLVAKMSQMTTDDKEVLLHKFAEIIYPQTVPPDLVAFYMDLANWNLSLALTVFYDQNGNMEHMEEAFRLASLSCSVLGCSDQNAVSGNHTYLPGEIFFCSWRVSNDGRFPWPAGTRLAFIDGDPVDYEVWEEMTLNPTEIGMANVKILAPERAGDYRARFQFVTPQNVFFGESIWVMLHVQKKETSPEIEQLTQRMQCIGGPMSLASISENAHIMEDSFGQAPRNSPQNDDNTME